MAAVVAVDFEAWRMQAQGGPDACTGGTDDAGDDDAEAALRAAAAGAGAGAVKALRRMGSAPAPSRPTSAPTAKSILRKLAQAGPYQPKCGSEAPTPSTDVGTPPASGASGASLASGAAEGDGELSTRSMHFGSSSGTWRSSSGPVGRPSSASSRASADLLRRLHEARSSTFNVQTAQTVQTCETFAEALQTHNLRRGAAVRTNSMTFSGSRRPAGERRERQERTGQAPVAAVRSTWGGQTLAEAVHSYNSRGTTSISNQRVNLMSFSVKSSVRTFDDHRKGASSHPPSAGPSRRGSARGPRPVSARAGQRAAASASAPSLSVPQAAA